jgi:hypothetical protein
MTYTFTFRVRDKGMVCTTVLEELGVLNSLWTPRVTYIP